jgi:thiol:disulfide interchange protein DsbD
VTIGESPSATAVVLAPEVTWLACGETCVPGKATLRLVLPIGNVSTPNAAEQPRFAALSNQAPSSASSAALAATTAKPNSLPAQSIWIPILFALLGGLLLNLMPCVFPILSIKALSVLQLSGERRGDVRKMGWAYTLGILVSFWALVGTLLVLRLGGRHIGWGFQLQSPHFVFVLACILFVFGLNLLGVFEIYGAFVSVGDGLARRSGSTGAFFTGVLATVVATPCTAPFMGAAVGFALSQTPLVIFAIFTALGFGLALPYLLICYLPIVSRMLPKPGAWMETLKQVMAFLVFGTTLWLAYVLSLQSSSTGLLLLMTAFVGLGFAAWLAARFTRTTPMAIVLGLAVVTSASLSLSKSPLPVAPATVQASDTLVWEAYSPEKLAAYRAQGKPVFVDFTAAWCVSCKVNETVIFHSEAVKKKLTDLGFVLLKADWTNEDTAITQALNAFGRSGVPFYVVYPRGKESAAMPLPEVLNAGVVLGALAKLG